MNDKTLCPLCGGPFTRPVIRGDHFSIRECPQCRLAATLPPTFVSTSEYSSAPQFAEAYAGQEAKFRGYARNLLAWVTSHVPNGRFLDVGCSVGLLVDEACRAGYEAEGIDLDSNAVDYGQKRGWPVFKSSLEDWPRSDYSVISLSHTLEHVPDPVSFLSACAAHLQTDGCLLVAVPCFAGLHPRIYRKRWYGWTQWQHYFHYSAPALRKVFETAGLAVVGTWQESMDHRPPYGNMRRRDIPPAFLSHAVARFGAALGQGDQLIGIARKQATAALSR